MTETLLHARPLNGHELDSYLTEMQAADPNALAPGEKDAYHPGTIEHTNYNQLRDAVHRIGGPLTEHIGDGEHI